MEEALAIAANPLGEDRATMRFVLSDPVVAYSNVLGSFFDTLGGPQLDFPEAFELVRGSSGSIDLNQYNTATPATHWGSDENLPAGAMITGGGMLIYDNIGVEGDE